MARRNLIFFEDVQREVRRRLAQFSPTHRAALAAACAERLMVMHLGLPPAKQRSFTLQWAPVPALIWRALEADDDGRASAEMRRRLGEFHASPYDHDHGQDGPDDADENAAAATILAAETFLTGAEASAGQVVARLIEEAFSQANRALEGPGRPQAGIETAEQFMEECTHPAVQEELRRVLDAVALLSSAGPLPSTIRQLRTVFATV